MPDFPSSNQPLNFQLIKDPRIKILHCVHFSFHQLVLTLVSLSDFWDKFGFHHVLQYETIIIIIIIITNFALNIEVPEHSNCRLVPYWREFLGVSGSRTWSDTPFANT